MFGCKVFILNTKDHLGKFTAKADEGILVGYSLTSKAYRVYNNRTKLIEEYSDVAFEEIPKSNDQSRDVAEIQFELRSLSLNDQNIERVEVDSDDDEQRQQRAQADPLPDTESLPVPSETTHEAPPTPR